MNVNLLWYQKAVGSTIRILKKKYTNLTAEEAYELATSIVDAIVNLSPKEIENGSNIPTPTT